MVRGTTFTARIAAQEEDVRACQRLRYLAFLEGRGLGQSGPHDAIDDDAFDPICTHVMVEDAGSGQLVCCFRLLPLNNGSEISRSYSAQYYELSKLESYPGKMVEMGRFCIHPAWKDPNILRVAWAAMTEFVDQEGVELLFGCSSFHGVDAEAYLDAFALLKEKHIAPKRWLPRPKAPNIFRFARKFKFIRPDMQQAMRRMPPLLRSYLVMGGWVSDHAVIDDELKTLHVFTGVEIKRVPPGRAAILRRLSALRPKKA